jgi:hypothetical protein
MTPTPPTAAQDTRQLEAAKLALEALRDEAGEQYRKQGNVTEAGRFHLWLYGACIDAAARLSPAAATAAEPRPAVERRTKRHVAQVEIVGPSGEVHYRRPLGDPMIEEAICTPGYSVRGDHPAPAAPAQPLAETGLNEAARLPEWAIAKSIPTWYRRADGSWPEHRYGEDASGVWWIADLDDTTSDAPFSCTAGECVKMEKDIELGDLIPDPALSAPAEPPPAGARGEKRWTQFLPFDLWADVVEAYESRNTDKLRGHIDAALADAEKRGAEMRAVLRRMVRIMACCDYARWQQPIEEACRLLGIDPLDATDPPAAALAQPVAGADAGGAK